MRTTNSIFHTLLKVVSNGRFGRHQAFLVFSPTKVVIRELLLVMATLRHRLRIIRQQGSRICNCLVKHHVLVIRLRVKMLVLLPTLLLNVHTVPKVVASTHPEILAATFVVRIRSQALFHD